MLDRPRWWRWQRKMSTSSSSSLQQIEHNPCRSATLSPLSAISVLRIRCGFNLGQNRPITLGSHVTAAYAAFLFFPNTPKNTLQNRDFCVFGILLNGTDAYCKLERPLFKTGCVLQSAPLLYACYGRWKSDSSQILVWIHSEIRHCANRKRATGGDASGEKDRHIDKVFGVENSLSLLKKCITLHYKKREKKHSKSLPQKKQE